MITITDARIENYLLKMSAEADSHLDDMEERASQTGVPIVGPLVGRLLHLLTRLKRPRLVVELGSGFGYSGYWFARAMEEEGKVVLIDHSEKNIAYARSLFEKAGLEGRAEFRVGDALRIGLEYDDIDLLFIDVDKYQYPEAIESMLSRLAKNALVVADNTLWHGTVIEDHPKYENSEAIRRFNEIMFGSDSFFTTLIPLRDGILLAYKLH